MNHNGKQSSLWKVAIAGGTSGILSLASIYPTEYLKTQLQFQNNNLTATQIIKNTWNNHGWKGFYRGSSPLFLASFPRSLIKFTVFEHVAHTLQHNTNLNKDTRNIVAGASAGLCTALFVSAPTDNVKIKTIHSQNVLQKRITAPQAILQIWKDDKITGFYRGIQSTIIKESYTYATRFLLYHRILGVLHQNKYEKPSAIITGISGGLASSMVAIANNPIDVIQTRLQSNYQGRYRGVLHCIVDIFRTEGWRSFFRGASYRSIRAVPGMTVQFYTYQWICNHLMES